VDARINPEPTDDERRAILDAIGGDGRRVTHPAYASPWRLAALTEATRAGWEAEGEAELPSGTGPASHD
jgi:hypothetical protein